MKCITAMARSTTSLRLNSFSIYTILQAWFLMIGFDFFLHAGILSPLYENETPFLLSSTQAFLRIPIGYISFLVISFLIFWLVIRIEIVGWKAGFIFGLQLGVLTWGAFILGLYSISTASTILLLSWFVGQSLEMALGGALIAHILETGNLKGSLKWVVISVVFFLILGIIIQNII